MRVAIEKTLDEIRKPENVPIFTRITYPEGRPVLSAYAVSSETPDFLLRHQGEYHSPKKNSVSNEPHKTRIAQCKYIDHRTHD